MSETAASERPGQAWVLHYSHRHGDDITLWAASDLAYAALGTIVREYWDEITDDDGVPDSPDALTDDQAIEMYFDRQDDESYSIDFCDIRSS